MPLDRFAPDPEVVARAGIQGAVDGTLIGGRLRTLVPEGWFGRSLTPARDAWLGGIGEAFADIFALLGYVRAQTRRATATGFNLDLYAHDFLAERGRRRAGEIDGPYRARIGREILRRRNTRAAVIAAVREATGLAPDLYEPWNPADCGAYGFAFAYAEADGSGGAGFWGSYDLPAQFFLRVRRPLGRVASLDGSGGYDVGALAYRGGDPPDRPSGYDAEGGGYGVGGFYYRPPAVLPAAPGAGGYGPPEGESEVSKDEIFALVADIVPAGTSAWVTFDPA